MRGCGLSYKGEKCDNKGWDLNYEHPFPRVSGYYGVSDIMEVPIMEFRVYLGTIIGLFSTNVVIWDWT